MGRVLGLAGQILDLVAEPDPRRQLGQMIQRRRQQLDLSIGQLARYIGGWPTDLQRVERGCHAPVNWTKLEDVLLWPCGSCGHLLGEDPSSSPGPDDTHMMLRWRIHNTRQVVQTLRVDIHLTGLPTVLMMLVPNDEGHWSLTLSGGSLALVLEHHEVAGISDGMRLAQRMITVHRAAVGADWEALRYDPSTAVRWVVANNVNCPPSVLTQMARSGDSSAPILQALASNPMMPAAGRAWLAVCGVRPGH